jgi:hypothetical protein
MDDAIHGPVTIEAAIHIPFDLTLLAFDSSPVKS